MLRFVASSANSYSHSFCTARIAKLCFAFLSKYVSIIESCFAFFPFVLITYQF